MRKNNAKNIRPTKNFVWSSKGRGPWGDITEVTAHVG